MDGRLVGRAQRRSLSSLQLRCCEAFGWLAMEEANCPFFIHSPRRIFIKRFNTDKKKLLYDQNIRINKPFSPTFILCLQLAGHSQPHLKLRDTLPRHRDELILASVMFTVLLIQQDLQQKQPKLLFVPEVWTRFADGSTMVH